MGGVGRGLEEGVEETIRGSEERGGTDVPVEICRGAGDLLPEDSPSLAFFACDVIFFSERPLLYLTKSSSESRQSSRLKSDMSTPSSSRR